MVQKLAIFDPTEQAALLGACESDAEYIPIFLMSRFGMHPSDVSTAQDKFRFNGQFLEWRRAKNSRLRRELVPEDILPRLQKWLKQGRKLSRVGYNQLVHRVGTRVGHPEYSPLTLRHTFCLEELRRFMRQKPPPPDFIALVAQKMGCTREVVMQNYIDLMQWEGLGGQQEEVYDDDED